MNGRSDAMAINLYEDSGGNLYIHQEGAPTAWCVRPGKGSFARDAEAISRGDVASWTAPEVEWGAVEPKVDESSLRHIACWSGPDQWEVVRRPSGGNGEYVGTGPTRELHG
jgi:hypothetical protein